MSTPATELTFRIIPQQDTPSRDEIKKMRITAAAVLVDGDIYTMAAPARHHNIIHHMTGHLKMHQSGSWEEGFITDTDFFVRRKPAMMIAENANQLLERAPTGPKHTLYSEDVW